MPVSKAHPGKGHEEGSFLLTGTRMLQRTDPVVSQALVEKVAEPAPEKKVVAPAPVAAPTPAPAVPARRRPKPAEEPSV